MIDFLKYRYVCLVVSLVLLGLGGAFFVMNNGFKYSIDFTGGTEVRLFFNNKVDIAKLRHAVQSASWQESVVQNVQGDQEYLVRMAADDATVEPEVKRVLDQEFGERTYSIKAIEQIGPEAGKEVRWNTLISILLVLLLLLLYISIRYQYAYALGAVVALGHDLLVLMTFYLVFGEQVSLNILAAILTVLGYSLNDTIVIYSKIWENMGMRKTGSLHELVNTSINQTLRRTMLTSFTTFVSVLALYLFGGDILRPFSLTMMIAVVVGTYSSVYIASPVMMYFSQKSEAQA